MFFSVPEHAEFSLTGGLFRLTKEVFKLTKEVFKPTKVIVSQAFRSTFSLVIAAIVKPQANAGSNSLTGGGGGEFSREL